MGMFDYLTCKLPGFECECQSKETPNQSLDCFEIREDGTFWEEEYDTEDRSDPNATGFAALCGMATKVNERWVPSYFSGALYLDWPDRQSVVFILRGKVVSAHDLSESTALSEELAETSADGMGTCNYQSGKPSQSASVQTKPPVEETSNE